jgi:multiple sugar transport system ATP-binding protein
MGRAIVRQPRAFLMDEPLSNLDAKLRVQMRAEIARLQRSLGVTTIYVTHDQIEAMTLGSRVAVIQHGVLQQVAAPQALYRQPANLFVAGFIGSPAMNLLAARLERGGGGPAVLFGPHRLVVPPQVTGDIPALGRYLGRDIVLGIRPESLQDAAMVHDPDPRSVIELPVELREELGSEVHVHCGTGASPVAMVAAAGVAAEAGAELGDASRQTSLVARMDPRTAITAGQAAKVHVDRESLHFFDPDTGQRIGS